MILGEPNVGKTSLANRCCAGRYSSENLASNKLIQEMTKEFIVRDSGGKDFEIKLNIYDCAGDNSNLSLLKNYWTEVHTVVLVYSLESKPSCDKLLDWVDAIN